MPIWDESQGPKIRARLSACDNAADNLKGILKKIKAKDSSSRVVAEKSNSKSVFRYFYACLDSFRSGVPFNPSDLPEINEIISQLASELKEINVDDFFYPKLSEILRRISNFKDRLENSYGFVERYSDDIDSIPVDIESGLEEEPEQLEDIPSIVTSFNETLDLNLSSLKNQKIFYQQLNNQIESISNQILMYSKMYREAISKPRNLKTIDLLSDEVKNLEHKKFELNAYKIELDSRFLFFKETDQFIIDGDGKISTIRGESLFSRIKSILLRLFFSRGVS